MEEARNPVILQIDLSASVLTVLPAKIVLKFCEAMQNVSINNDDE